MTAAGSDCRAFGCVGLPHCDYCGQLIDSPDARTVLVAAARLRRGDVYGALRLLTAASNPTAPEPTGPVGSSNLTHQS